MPAAEPSCELLSDDHDHRPDPTTARRPRRPARTLLVALVVTALVGLLGACASGGSTGSSPAAGGTAANAGKTLTIGAIPDQDPQKLQRLYGTVADYLASTLGVKVVYKPVTDYAAAVSLFRTGDLQLVWFGGLTGTQARLQTPGSQVLVQREIDSSFHSLFIANTSAGLAAVNDVGGLKELSGKRFTYGSQSSTSGFLMPAYFLTKAGLNPRTAFAGEAGYSGSHDKTIDLVTSGTYQAGVVNEQVWKTRLAAGTIDTSKVSVLYRTPAFSDYHWLAGPDVATTFGAGFPARISQAFEALDASKPADKAVLDLFGAKQFVPAHASNYTQIEQVGRQLGLITAK